jgi:hypothetical protein
MTIRCYRKFEIFSSLTRPPFRVIQLRKVQDGFQISYGAIIEEKLRKTI